MKTQFYILPNINFTFIIKDVEMPVNREFHLIEHHIIIKRMLLCEPNIINHVHVHDKEIRITLVLKRSDSFANALLYTFLYVRLFSFLSYQLCTVDQFHSSLIMVLLTHLLLPNQYNRV